MAYTKAAATSGFKSGGFKGGAKKEYDPTIVSAKDVLMSRMNAITAVYNLEAARISQGLPEVARESLDAEVERIFTITIAQADNVRVGSATKAAVRPISAPSGAEATVAAAFEGTVQVTEDTPYADLVLKSGKHAGNTLADVYGEDPTYVTGFLADASKNKNTFTLKAAQAFVLGSGGSDEE